MSEGALEGLRILDLTQGVAGPYCTKLLSDYGAGVLKIERPEGGDPARRAGPFPDDEPHPERSGLFLDLNTGKRSFTLNLKTESGQRILRRLAADSDAVVENFRPGTLARLGLSEEQLAELNPATALVSISNFGQHGPYRDFEADDMLLYAMGGGLAITAYPGREPSRPWLYAPLFLAGAMSASYSLGAITSSVRFGEGERVDLSIQEILASSLDRASQNLMAYSYGGELFVTEDCNLRASAFPSGVYGGQLPCKDGYVNFLCYPYWWDRFCRMVGREDLIDDKQLLRQPARPGVRVADRRADLPVAAGAHQDRGDGRRAGAGRPRRRAQHHRRSLRRPPAARARLLRRARPPGDRPPRVPRRAVQDERDARLDPARAAARRAHPRRCSRSSSATPPRTSRS